MIHRFDYDGLKLNEPKLQKLNYQLTSTQLIPVVLLAEKVDFFYCNLLQMVVHLNTRRFHHKEKPELFHKR